MRSYLPRALPIFALPQTRALLTVTVFNIAAWAVALWLLRGNPVLAGTAILAYTLGLRHAVDADHIAVIDNATRSMMCGARRPAAAGLFFSLGHSSVVVLLCLAVSVAATSLKGQIAHLRFLGSVLGSVASSVFLFGLAALNMAGLVSQLRAVQRGQVPDRVVPAGIMGRMLAPLLTWARSSWQLYPVGFLMGLGFDTATEIALLALAAAEAAHGLGFWVILIFPALFTAGMSLVDTLDGLLMLKVYGWALSDPVRKAYYNIALTALSVAVAILVGATDVLDLVRSLYDPHGRFWALVGGLNRQSGLLGTGIVALFLLGWAVSALIYRLRLQVRVQAGTG